MSNRSNIIQYQIESQLYEGFIDNLLRNIKDNAASGVSTVVDNVTGGKTINQIIDDVISKLISPELTKRLNFLYIGSLVVMASAVSLILVKAILSVLKYVSGKNSVFYKVTIVILSSDITKALKINEGIKNKINLHARNKKIILSDEESSALSILMVGILARKSTLNFVDISDNKTLVIYCTNISDLSKVEKTAEKQGVLVSSSYDKPVV